MEPGEYLPDATEGITRVADLPPPLVERRSRCYRRRSCPRCGKSCYRDSVGHRILHDVGDLRSGRPRDRHVRYSKHHGRCCRTYFNADLTDLAPAGSRYTQRIIALAVRLAVEEGLPYRLSSWHLWRDHRVFVPYATIQNWVEAAEKKGRRPS
jgi:hypothetical protein